MRGPPPGGTTGGPCTVQRAASPLRFRTGLSHQSRLTSALTPRADKVATEDLRPLCAMCGRLRVGKDFLHVAGLVGAAMCSAC
jgi:hypothetical protein